MIQAESDPQKKDECLQKLMELSNQKWAEIVGQARQSVDFLKDRDVIRTMLNILQTNASVATSLGTYFLSQITRIFLDMLNVSECTVSLYQIALLKEGPLPLKRPM